MLLQSKLEQNNKENIRIQYIYISIMSYNYKLLVVIEKSYLNTENHTYIFMKEVFILIFNSFKLYKI